MIIRLFGVEIKLNDYTLHTDRQLRLYSFVWAKLKNIYDYSTFCSGNQIDMTTHYTQTDNYVYIGLLGQN